MSGLRIVLQRLVGPLVFFAGMVACMTVGEPLALGVGLTWRNVVAMCAIPWLCGYTGYHMGWINGHYAGWIKARDEHRPNEGMSKRTVTMKSLIDENVQLRMRVNQLEVEIAGYKARSSAPPKLWDDWRFTAGMALGWLLGWGFNCLVLSR